MITGSLLILASGGFLSGVMAGLLGIGGGFIVVSLLVSLGYTPLQAIATSSLVIVISSISGSLQNWRMGYLDYKRVLYLGLPALVTAQIGVYWANRIPPYLLLITFGVFLIASIYLVNFRKRLSVKRENSQAQTFNPVVSRIGTGGASGILTGLLGVGGGAVMVPLQMLLLGEPIKVAIQTSLGVIVATAVSACVGHASEGNILFFPGLILGFGGLLGAQISTRFLPKLPDSLVYLLFRGFLAAMSIYMFWQAWKIYQGL
ncbi:MAG: sulfite exporter TauE/SafE family protein [Coleofasciculaceae cyanobacterium]